MKAGPLLSKRELEGMIGAEVRRKLDEKKREDSVTPAVTHGPSSALVDDKGEVSVSPDKSQAFKGSGYSSALEEIPSPPSAPPTM